MEPLNAEAGPPTTPDSVFGARNARDIAKSNRLYRRAFYLYAGIILCSLIGIIGIPLGLLPKGLVFAVFGVLAVGLVVAIVGFIALTVLPVLRLSREYEGGSRMYFLVNAPMRSERFPAWCDEHGYRRIGSGPT